MLFVLCYDRSMIISYITVFLVLDSRYKLYDFKEKHCQQIMTMLFYGRSGGTRTHGLQYPKLARYHLRYASIDKKLLNFVVVSYVVNPEF